MATAQPSRVRFSHLAVPVIAMAGWLLAFAEWMWKAPVELLLVSWTIAPGVILPSVSGVSFTETSCPSAVVIHAYVTA